MRHVEEQCDSLMCDHFGTLPTPAPCTPHHLSKPPHANA